MNSKILPLFIIIILLSCKEKKVTPLEIANTMVKEYENKNSLSYDINYRIKYFSEVEDTTKVSAHIDLIRQPTDSIFGGSIWITSDSIERYYDTNNTYYIDHRTKIITRYPEGRNFAITGNTVGDAIRMYFLKPNRFINGATDSTIQITVHDQELNGKHYWKLAYAFEDDEYTENTSKNIWIEKENYFIPKMNFSSDMQGENQYNQWDLSKMAYDKVTIKDLEKRFNDIKQNYVLEEYKERPREEQSLLSNGTKIPELSGIQHSDRTTVSLSDYDGKVVLLDFWYMDCFPCIKAIPHLNDIQRKYKDDGLVVIGANPFDDNEKNLKRMPNFLSNNPIDYQILFVERNKIKDFKIFAFPSFYLIDKKGNIVHSEIGFSEEATSKIDSLIQIHL